MKRIFLFVTLSICLFCHSSWGQKNIYTVDISDLSTDETAAILTLQGLCNRETPQLMVKPGDKGGFKSGGYLNQHKNSYSTLSDLFSKQTMDSYASLEDAWIDFYTNKYGYKFTEISFEDAFDRFASYYNGLIVYGGARSTCGIPLAITVSAHENGIPVTRDLLASHKEFKGKKILVNLEKMKFKNKLDAHRWVMAKYLDRSSKEFAWSYWDKENNLFTADFAVRNKAFAFDLSFASEKIHKDLEKEFPYDKEEEQLFDQIASHLNPGSAIAGWGEPNEFILQARCGDVGHVLLCTNVSPNLSLHQSMPIQGKNRKQIRQISPENVLLENKVYITFSINEGDTYKSIGNLMLDGMWLQQARGSVPFNWPINPFLLDLLPGLADYYYSTMTGLDYFYVPTSGIGYFDATFSTPEQREVYASKNKTAIAHNDMHYIDVWWNNFKGNESWIESMGVKGYNKWTSRQCVNYDTPIPSIESDLYYKLANSPKGMAEYIKNQTASMVAQGKPWFVHVYACSPYYAKKVMEYLGSDQYKAVCMDEFFLLAQMAREKIEGLKIEKNEDLVKVLSKE